MEEKEFKNELKIKGINLFDLVLVNYVGRVKNRNLPHRISTGILTDLRKSPRPPKISYITIGRTYGYDPHKDEVDYYGYNPFNIFSSELISIEKLRSRDEILEQLRGAFPEAQRIIKQYRL